MSLFHQCKAYKTEEGKANIKALVAIDLLELRHVPKGTNKLLVLEPTQKRSARSNRPPPPGQPTAEELERRHEEKNVEINRENSILMKKRLELFSFFVKLCIPAVLPVKAWEKNATYVDMDSKFYDDVRNHEGNGTVITLDKARKRSEDLPS